MTKSFYEKIDKKIMNSKIMKAIHKKAEVINKLTSGKDDTKMNIKEHTMTKKWTALDRKLLNLTAGNRP